MFNLSQLYTRAEIQRLIGGELQTYLPQKNNRILAGCFNKELNPDCPNEIQVGVKQRVRQKALLLIEQPETIFPVFIKESKRSKFYRFEGMFYCSGSSYEKDLISAAEVRSGRLGEVTCILYLRSVSS